ncbi:CDP-diacylglycerol diphosphatase [Paraburkholderia dilworthii]|uniref:CDP-diacylglycerol diphosphatase n=1 Tax=Paraburkholderia dilworthii TaxID=948106 RepID=UPI0004220601|nr:CDP-diacylglycerol diphosphatase [Paraburkholderia dilworthii]
MPMENALAHARAHAHAHAPITTPENALSLSEPDDHGPSHKRASYFRRVIAAVGIALAAAGCARLAAVDSNALWKIVNMRCVPSQQATGTPGQCTLVDLDKRYAILKDIVGRSQYLLIPTDRISGIESPLVLAPQAPSYWSDAWAARSYVNRSVKRTLPDNQLGLEINSQFRRSQNQLHIHIDCMRRDISDALASHAKDAPGEWHWDTLNGNRYRIMRVTALTGASDPFHLVSHDNPGSDAMAMQTILVTGAGPSAEKDGWLVLNSGLDANNGSGSAEDLLDHACRVADGSSQHTRERALGMELFNGMSSWTTATSSARRA